MPGSFYGLEHLFPELDPRVRRPRPIARPRASEDERRVGSRALQERRQRHRLRQARPPDDPACSPDRPQRMTGLGDASCRTLRRQPSQGRCRSAPRQQQPRGDEQDDGPSEQRQTRRDRHGDKRTVPASGRDALGASRLERKKKG